MEQRKTAAAATTTEIQEDTAKILNCHESAKDSTGNRQGISRISLIGDELARCEGQLNEMSINNDKHKADKLLFESLGYKDKDQFERLVKFIEKEPFNDLDSSITCPKFRFNIHGIDCVPTGEIIGIGGKPGTGKSTSLAIFIGVLMGKTSFAGIRCLTPCHKVLWIDTEKGDFSCKQKMAIFRRVANMVDDIPLKEHGVIFRQMRGERLIDRIAFIDILFAKDDFDCVVIDGIFDLTDDANDNCAPVIELLQRIVQRKGTSVFAMLHTNKNDDNFRYAMGTELTRIATTLFKTSFDKGSGNHTTTHDKSNDTALAPPIIFRVANDGSIYEPDSPAKVERKKDTRTQKIEGILQRIFAEKESYQRKSEIADAMCEADRNLKKDTAKKRVVKAIEDGILLVGNDKKIRIKKEEK